MCVEIPREKNIRDTRDTLFKSLIIVLANTYGNRLAFASKEYIWVGLKSKGKMCLLTAFKIFMVENTVLRR